MDDLLYNSCLKYFTSLANFGFKSELDVKKLLFYVFTQELVSTTSIAIPEDDYKHLEGALYSMYGTTCLIPYPDYCERPMYAHLGDIAELSARMAKVEDVNDRQDVTLEVHTGQIADIQALDRTQNSRLDDIEGTSVVKGEGPGKEISDIIVS